MEEELDLVVANAENAAGGSGLTPTIYHELISCGVDCITMGDHIYRRHEIFSVLETEARIVRPANFPAEAPGREYTLISCQTNRETVAVISLLGRVFMKPVDCPFQAADRVLSQIPPEAKSILVDFHAEATSDKQLMGRYLDGRVTAVLGTHTHVATADEQILPGGTAHITDVGMTGAKESIIGVEIEPVLRRFRTQMPARFDPPDSGTAILCGVALEIDPETGRAWSIERIQVEQTFG